MIADQLQAINRSLEVINRSLILLQILVALNYYSSTGTHLLTSLHSSVDELPLQHLPTARAMDETSAGKEP